MQGEESFIVQAFLPYNFREDQMTAYLTDFTMTARGATEEEVEELLDRLTIDFLNVLMKFPTQWECVDEYTMADPAWVPGSGRTGEIRGYKGFRKFHTMEGGEIMGEPMTPAPEETPAEPTEEIVDDPSEETPEEETPAEEESPDEETPEDMEPPQE